MSIPQQIPAGAAVPDDDEANVFTYDAITVKCSHHIDDELREASRFPFAVVPDPGSRGETVRFDLNYDSEEDEELKLLSAPNSEVEKWGILRKEQKSSGGYVWKLDCTAPLSEEGLVSITSREYWAQQQEPNTYKLQGPKGKEYQVECYCPDQWQLEFSLPAMKSYEAGRKIEQEVEFKEGEIQKGDRYEKAKASEQTWDPLTREVATVDEQAVRGPKGISVESSYTEANTLVDTITLRKNEEEVSVEILELIGSCLQLAKILRGVLQKIQDDVPKIGWYYKWDLQFMQGKLDFRWGWKEYTKPGRQHEAFYWASLNANLSLFGGSIELGIGVETVGFSLQIFGRIQGGLRVVGQLQRTSPDSDAGIKMGIDGKVKGLLGARFEVAYVVKLNGDIATSFVAKGDFQVSTNESMQADIDIYWTGIVATLTYTEEVRTKFGGYKKERKSKTLKLLEPESEPGFMLGSWSWPKGPSYDPGGLSRSEIREIMSDTLKQGHKLLGGEWNVDVEGLDLEEDVVDDIVTRICDREDILTDQKNIQAMALEIRHELAGRMDRSGIEFSPDVSPPDYQNFLWFELENILNSYEDPARKMLQEAKSASDTNTETA